MTPDKDTVDIWNVWQGCVTPPPVPQGLVIRDHVMITVAVPTRPVDRPVGGTVML